MRGAVQTAINKLPEQVEKAKIYLGAADVGNIQYMKQRTSSCSRQR